MALLTALHILPAALMQFMGDQPKPRGKDALSLLYELLKVSQKPCAKTWSVLPAWARMDAPHRLLPTPCSPPPGPNPSFSKYYIFKTASGATFLAILLCRLHMLA